MLWPRLALIVVLLGALAIRVFFSYTAYVFKDDDGTAALMSLHIMEGREAPLYFYGWFYVSALGAYVGALMYLLFGVSTVSLCLAMTLFSLLWVFATYLLFSRLVGRWGGVLAAALVAFSPFTAMWYSVKPLLGYPPTFAFGTLAIYLGVRLNDRPLSRRAEWACVLGLAALSGVAIWTNPLCMAYLIVAFGLLVAHVVRVRLRRALLRKLVVGLVVLAAALTPVIMTAHEEGLTAMFGFRSPRTSLVSESAALVRTFYIEDMIFNGSPLPAGSRAHWLVAGAYAVAAVGLCAAFVAGVVGALWRRGGRLRRASAVPVLFVLVYAALFLPSPMAGFKAERYFVPFYLGVCAIFVWPFALGRRWVSMAAAGLAVVVIAHNLVVVLANPNGDAGRERMAEMRSLVEQVKAAGLRHVMIDSLEGQPLTFVAREEVVFARSVGERYYPYALAAAGDDRAAFGKAEREARTFQETLDALGIEASGRIRGAELVVFHGLKLPEQGLRLIEAERVEAHNASTDSGSPGWLIDGDEETIFGDKYAVGTSLVIDFGRDVALGAVRFVAPHARDCPAGYRLSGLPDVTGDDDSSWVELQSVRYREALAAIYGNRLYNRGGLLAMECRFEPRDVRYLRIDSLRSPNERTKTVWRFQEIYCYEQDDGTPRPDEADVRSIVDALESRGVASVFCDEWLSRKIEQLDESGLNVVPHHETLYPETHVSRIVPLRAGVAVVVEDGHADQCAELIKEAALNEVGVERVRFGHYAALVVTEGPGAYATFPGLRWNGFTLIRAQRLATAAWCHERGAAIEQAEGADEAATYYERAYDTFPGIPANLRKLAPDRADVQARLDELTPEHDARIEFPGGISLVGYTLMPSPLVAGRTATLRLVWELEGTIPHSHLPVFVHFLQDGEIRFQADHTARLPVLRHTTVPRSLVLDEHEFAVPSDCPIGELRIRLGGLKWFPNADRLKPRTKLPTHERAVEVGRVEVVHSPGE